MSGEPSGPPPLNLRLIFRLSQLIAVLCAILATTTVITASVWWLTPTRDLDVLVYDQTVIDETYPAHLALEPILDYHHVDYDPADYVGASIGGELRHGTWPTEPPDLIVLADAYGVYADADGEVSDYGFRRLTEAFSAREATDVAEWVAAGVPAYAEFALVTEPTPPAAALLLESTFGFRSTGWSGRSVEDLQDLAPRIKALQADPWDYEGPGVVFVSASIAGRRLEPQVIVLELSELNERLPRVVGGPPNAIGGSSTFEEWFTIVEPAPGTTVDAWFEIDVDEDGAAVLEAAGLPARFPALIRRSNTIYYAGDGLANETPFRLNHVHGGATFTRLVTGQEFRFFYQVLEPSFGWLLNLPEPAEAETVTPSPEGRVPGEAD